MTSTKATEALIHRALELVTKGSKLLATATQPQLGVSSYVEADGYEEWFIKAETLCRSAPKAAAHYVDQLRLARGKHASGAQELKRGVGIIRGLADDLQNGPMSDVRGLVRAELFGDMLEQAEHLRDGGYLVAASVTAGVVLEQHLRKLCEARGVTLPERATLGTIVGALYKAEAFDATQKKLLDHLAGIRNDAAHEGDATKDNTDRIIGDVPRVILALPI